jgi:hypothetical protein
MGLAFVRINQLKINPTFVELRPINIFYISQYRQSYRVGANFPPLLVDADTNTVVSGNHRLTALREEFPADHKIQVKLKKYENDRQRLEDFTRENVAHGNALDGITRKRLSRALLDSGVTLKEVAEIFNRPAKTVAEWGKQFVKVGGKLQPIKKGFHPKGGKLSKSQYKEHAEHDRGVPAIQQCNQLRRWAKGGHIIADEEHREAAIECGEALLVWANSFPVVKEADIG